MVKFCLMASHGYPSCSWLVSDQTQGVCKVIKDCQPFLACCRTRSEMIKPGSLDTRARLFQSEESGSLDTRARLFQSEEPWNPLSGLPESHKFVEIGPPKPVLHLDTHLQSVHFSLGIAEQCTRQEKILQFLVSGSSEMERGVNLSSLSDLIGLQDLTTDDMQQHPHPLAAYSEFDDAEFQQSSLVYPSDELHLQKPLVDFVGDLARDSKIVVHPDGHVSFAGSGTEMKDILSIVAEFYLSKNSRKQTVVPYFNRPKRREVQAGSSLNLLGTLKIAPSKSCENVKHKQSSKKCNKKPVLERNFYEKNYFHACETLLSLMIDKRRNGKTSVLSLKKSGPELPELLTQCSASIAGTGIAVLVTVILKVACGRVPLCSSKLLNTGFGFGLVWLSWAVNRLRDTVVSISKNSSKLNLTEEEMVKRVDGSVNEIFFRAAALMAIVVLRFA